MSDYDEVGAGGPGRGAGSSLHPAVLISAGIATAIATVVAFLGIFLQLKNYRKPILQRMVVRIMLMVPLYAVSSLIALFSLDAAFAIDAIRDIYEAFVIYAFFNLMINYLGGERSLLILLYGRPPKHHVFPVSLFKRDLDASDPFTFLFLKRGILQYVQVKPILAATTLILKATGTYKEGELSWSAGYLYVSFIYNASICLSLYCLAMFWVCVNADIKPFRPVPKFLCVKGILFFSFWQALGISALVAAGIIKQVGPYTDSEHISLAITDTLICYEMPFFAFAHWFAFSHTDYIDNHLQYAARMPFYYAFRDAFGILDVLEDSRVTLRGAVSYRTFEPVEGGMHQGTGRERRIRAGLRYAQGGQKKYWIPMPHDTTDVRAGPINALKGALQENRQTRHGYAPLLDGQGIANNVFHDETVGPSSAADGALDDPFDQQPLEPGADDEEWAYELEFDDPDSDPSMEKLYAESQKLLFGDYHYPNIDVSGEQARRQMWDEEERILKDQRAAFSPMRPTHPKLSLLSSPTSQPSTSGGRYNYGATRSLDLSASYRSNSDPDPGAIRSAISRLKGKESGRMGVYGAWAEEDVSSSSQKPPGDGYVTPISDDNGPIIDYTPHQSVPGADSSTDINLRYARSTRPLVLNTPPSRSTAVRTAPEPRPESGSRPSSLKASSGSSTPPSVERQKHLSIQHVPPETSGSRRGSSALPSDAIDLVVEDKEAEQKEMARERRKGEPAVRQTGERKVYRREYVVQGPDGKGKDVQVEVEEDEGVENPQQGDRSKPAVEQKRVKEREEDESGNVHQVEYELNGDGEEKALHSEPGGGLIIADNVPEEEITRAISPPSHARVDPYSSPFHTSPVIDEDNPWA